MCENENGLKISIDVPANVTTEALSFVQKVLGPVAEASAFLSDKIRFFRWNSAVRTIERAHQIAKERGISPQSVPIKFLVPFLENCSLEEENSELTEEWAKLLASASGNFESKHILYSSILSRIGPKEAIWLRNYWKKVDRDIFSAYVSAIQAFGVDYAVRTASGDLKSPYGDTLSLDAIGSETAKKHGCFTVSSIGGPTSSKQNEIVSLPFANVNYWKGMRGKLGERGTIDPSLLILEKERLIVLKSYTQETPDFESILWAELTPLGMDFVDTLEGMSDLL